MIDSIPVKLLLNIDGRKRNSRNTPVCIPACELANIGGNILEVIEAILIYIWWRNSYRVKKKRK